MHRKKILIVDDDPGTRVFLSKTLTKHGFQTKEAGDGLEALEAVVQEKPDLVILDELMPRLDGFGFLHRLNTLGHSPRVPVIMLSVASDRKHLEKGISLHADYYLSKPCSVDNLMRYVKSLVGDSAPDWHAHHGTIKKDLPGIGVIEYKIASSREEVEAAMALIYTEYLKRGFILKDDYKSHLRITKHNVSPDTVVFIGLHNKKVVITNTIVPDSPLGLPMDMGYHQDLEKLRHQGRSLCEVGYLAIDSSLFGHGCFSMFNFRKLDFMFTIFKLIFQFALFRKEMDDICIVTNPKYLIFKFIPFEVIGKVKYYGYDHSGINKKAAVPKRLDLKKMRQNLGKVSLMNHVTTSLYKIFLGDRFPDEVLQQRYRFDRDDLHHFFVKKSDILKSLHKHERDAVMAAYGLSEAEFEDVLKGKV